MTRLGELRDGSRIEDGEVYPRERPMRWDFPWSRRVVTNHLGHGLMVCWAIENEQVVQVWVVRPKKPRHR